MNRENYFDLRLPAEMAKMAVQAGVYKTTKKPEMTFSLAMTAGIFISIAFAFYITVTAGPTPAGGLTKLVSGLAV